MTYRPELPKKAANIRRVAHVIVIAIAMSAGAALADTKDGPRQDDTKTVTKNHILLAGLGAEETEYLQQLRQTARKTRKHVQKLWRQKTRELRTKHRPRGKNRRRR